MLFGRTKKKTPPELNTWRTPGGNFYDISAAALDAEHTLIAGTTGCGKTTFVRSIMQAALVRFSPAAAKFILIDPKRFELSEYEKLPHVVRYARTAAESLSALEYAAGVMHARAEELESQGGKHYRGARLYVIIDELNDLMISPLSAKIRRVMEHIITLGRALEVHLIACTQNPNAKTIPANIVDCYTCRYGLKCMRSVQSRQIVGESGCEMLPKHGETIAIINGEIGRYQLPYVTEEEIAGLIEYWTSDRCRITKTAA